MATRFNPDWSEREDIPENYNIDKLDGPKYLEQPIGNSEEDETVALMFQDDPDPETDLDNEGFLINPEFEWKPIPWVNSNSRQVPFGYKRREDDPSILDPIPLELEVLERGKKYLNRYSYGTVAKWISAVTGRNINYNSLWRRVQLDKGKDKRARAYRKWAARYKAALAAAERIEAEVGAGRPRPYTLEGKRLSRPAPLTTAPRAHPEDFDDGTPAEHVKDAGKRRRGPRRPRSTRRTGQVVE